MCLIKISVGAVLFLGITTWANEVHQRSADITVLRAEEGQGLTADQKFDFARCESNRDGRLDCTNELTRITGAPAKESLTIRTLKDFDCSWVKIVTLTRRLAFESSAGIGFYSSGWGHGRFIPVGELKSIGEVTLKSGEPAILHVFSGVVDCWQGSVTSSVMTHYDFRPYVRFETATHVYFNWDNVPTDYQLSFKVRSFDRSEELLN